VSNRRASAKRGAATKAAQREIAKRLREKWHVFESDDRDNGRYVLDGFNNLVADCFADTHLGFGLPDRDDWQRNARLIAKVPAMCEFIGTICRMKTEEEFGERFSTDDSIETLNNLIRMARKIAGETRKS